MWAAAMLLPPERIVSALEEEKKGCVRDLIALGRNRAGAVEYVKHVKRLMPNAPDMGGVCPGLFIYLFISGSNHPWSPHCRLDALREGVLCKSVEFDNIKVFYHPTMPNGNSDGWNFISLAQVHLRAFALMQ